MHENIQEIQLSGSALLETEKYSFKEEQHGFLEQDVHILSSKRLKDRSGPPVGHAMVLPLGGPLLVTERFWV